MQDIYIKNKKGLFSESELEMCLYNIINIVEHFPRGNELELLKKINQTNVH